MDRKPDKSSSELAAQLGRAAHARKEQQFVLRLFVAGTTPRSQRAIVNIRRICEQHLQGRYALDVIDIYQQPAFAASEQIIVAPTLIKTLPLPLRRIVGDLSETQRVLVGLELHPIDADAAKDDTATPS